MSVDRPDAFPCRFELCYPSFMSALLKITNEAEGLMRRRFIFEGVEWMTRAGILEEDERIELIDGEIAPALVPGLAVRLGDLDLR
ncbi:hypothetical protein [Enterovirga sp.]|uniref:hypothetical protein n=1 Tax=Enterovirga sp. TaxID=2026350 RepID=UPI002B9B25CD|nr:hypothetical protein [Enterovirga sp.]HMO31283.1 hypothetical protein [Enterovirga sp.]